MHWPPTIECFSYIVTSKLLSKAYIPAVSPEIPPPIIINFFSFFGHTYLFLTIIGYTNYIKKILIYIKIQFL